MGNLKTDYIPILKWREGEKHSIKLLDDNMKSKIIPLIELVNDEGDNTSDLSQEIYKYWSNRPIYLDVHYRPPAFAIAALNNIQHHRDGIDVIPVVRLNSEQIIIDGIRNVEMIYRNGYAIRVVIESDQSLSIVNRQIELILKNIPRSKNEIDLIVDFGYLDSTIKYNETLKMLKNKMPLDHWRRIIIASGNMPPTLLEFTPNDDNFLKRLDFNLWAKHKNTLHKNSIYSDYTVRYPNNIAKGGLGTISIRYTLQNEFQIFRGRKNDGFFKYLVHSANIRSLYSDIYPPNFSWGDDYIKDKEDQLLRCLAQGYDPETYGAFLPGSKSQWVTASINHHIAVVLKKNIPSMQL